MSSFSIPRFVISADRSSSGKTTISIGIMNILTKLGYSVQGFKVAMDYVDPQYHTDITGRYSRNLDSYLMSDDQIIDIFINACNYKKKADIAIIEGVRGLYEGYDNDIGSTAHISKILKAPIIFVMNAKSITKSCAAILNGFSSLDKDIQIKGVILNNIKNKTHEMKVTESIINYTNIPIVGIIYRNNSFKFDIGSLGLASINEQYQNKTEYFKKIEKLTNDIKSGIDIHKILNIAKNSKPIIINERYSSIFKNNDLDKKDVTIGIPIDEAFNFYYKDNLDLFEIYGSNIKVFSILNDQEIPSSIDCLYIGGGNLENFLGKLSENKLMKESIKKASNNGMPIYAESSGMCYLTEKIIFKCNNKINEYEMVGLFPGTSIISNNKKIVSYTNGIFNSESIIGNKSDEFKGHEYHNTEIIKSFDDTSNEYVIDIKRGKGIFNFKDGIKVNNTIGTYTHFHGVSYSGWIKKLISSALKYKMEKNKQ